MCLKPETRCDFALRTSHFDRTVSAFTLIELLLAITVCGIVLLAAHTVFFSALRLRNTTTEKLDTAAPVEHALAIMRRDLRNLVVPGDKIRGQLQTSPTNTVVAIGTRGGQPVSPDLYTAVGIVDEWSSWPEIQQVTYVLATPTNQTDGLDLLRNVRRNPLSTDDLPEEQWLLDGVESVLFQFYNGLQWVDTWDSSTAETILPTAIRVQIQRVSESSSLTRPEPIEMIVPITVQARTNLTAEAEEGGGES